MKKVFKLDLKNWISGSGSTVFGKGEARLINDDKYMCCLGQFSVQLDKNAKIEGSAMPNSAEYTIPISQNPLIENKDHGIGDSELSQKCAEANDSCTMTTLERIDKIRKNLNEKGMTLKVVNDKLFDSRGNFIGKHLLENEWSGWVEDGDDTLVNFVESRLSVKKLLKRKSSPFTRKLIETVGAEKAREIFKKYTPNLVVDEEN